MNLTDNARNLLSSLGEAHGIPNLDFADDDLIPIVVDGLQMALTYRASEDVLVLLGVIDLEPVFDDAAAWSIFKINSDLVATGTRLAIDPRSGALFLICAIHCCGLGLMQLNERMDEFVGRLSDLVTSQSTRAREASTPSGRSSTLS